MCIVCASGKVHIYLVGVCIFYREVGCRFPRGELGESRMQIFQGERFRFSKGIGSDFACGVGNGGGGVMYRGAPQQSTWLNSIPFLSFNWCGGWPYFRVSGRFFKSPRSTIVRWGRVFLEIVQGFIYFIHLFILL